jgi:hypothetical protein
LNAGVAYFGMRFLGIRGGLDEMKDWFTKVTTMKKKTYPNPTNLRILRTPSQAGKYVQEKIDPILDKIAKHGIQSLTVEERKILDEAKDRLP